MSYSAPKLVVIAIGATLLAHTPAFSAPYAPSPVITGISFDASTHRFGAVGSDNWPITWADDDHQYNSGGDGNGFAGNQRSSLIVSRIDGSKDAYFGTDIWESADSNGTGPDNGKSYGIISVDGVLYMWVSPASGTMGYSYSKVWTSTDKGQNWSDPGWQFDGLDAFGSGKHGFINPTFLQFGKDYQGSRDNFVYMYASELYDVSTLQVQTPGEIVLMRVPKTQIADRAAYEFFAGLDNSGNPVWSTDIQQRQPSFQDSNGVGWNLSVSYNAPLNRYLLTTEHGESVSSNLGIFDAPTPWGPWTTVMYERWSVPGTGGQSHFFWNFSNKWLSTDGKNFVMISTGTGDQDRWNSIEGSFVVEVTVPNVVGLDQSAAESSIVSANLVVGTVSTAFSDTVLTGKVISQSPAGGSSLESGTAVILLISLGPPVLTLVPDVVGLDQATAESAIVSAGLVEGAVITAFSDTVSAGKVISQSPAGGASVAMDTAVNLVISLGATQLTVIPDVVGLDQAAAESAIESAGLVVGAVTTANNESVPAGNVISQTPIGGSSAAMGTAVAAVVSLGPVLSVPRMISPADGSTLSGSSQTFTWSADGAAVTTWGLEIGTTPGARDLYRKSFSSSVTSQLVAWLPTNGSSVYVSLRWKTGRLESVANYVYIAAEETPRRKNR